MKTLKLFLPIMLSVTLLGCSQETANVTTQTISVQKVTPANVAKPKTTEVKQNDDNKVTYVESVTEPVTTTEPTTPVKKSASSSNAALKDVMIDGNGTIVFTKADGTFFPISPIQGQKGDKGEKGDRGDQGERGADGINGVDGKDGRGIDHCELTDTKDLVIYYTDGTSQNVGNLTVTVPSEDNTQPVDDTPNYEKVGFKVPSKFSYPHTQRSSYSVSITTEQGYKNVFCDLIVLNCECVLKGYDTTTPLKKYVYEATCSYSFAFENNEYDFSTYNTAYPTLAVKFNDGKSANFGFDAVPISETYTYTTTFSSEIPLVYINDYDCPSLNFF